MSGTPLYPFIVLAFLILMNGQLPAQSNLEYYLEQAVKRSPFLQDFRYQQEIADLEIQKIKNQFEKPQWTVTGDYLLAPYFFNNGKPIAITASPDAKAFGYDAGVTNGGLYSGQVNVNYQLYSERQSRPLVEQQGLANLGRSNQISLLQTDLKRRITADYINAYLVLQQIDYVRQIKEQLLEKRTFIRKLADRGLMRITDLELLSLELKNQDYQISTLETQYRQAIQILHSDVGIVDTSFVRLSPVALETEIAKNVSVFLEQYRLDSLAAINDQAIFETRYLPQINVFANGGINAVEINNIYRKIGVSAGIHLSWLIKDGGQKNINTQQNEIRKLNAHNQSQFINNQIQNNRLNSVLVLQQSRQNIALLDTQLEGYQKLLTTYQQEFALGQLSVIDYLNVVKTFADIQQQKALLETQLLLIINELNYWGS